VSLLEPKFTTHYTRLRGRHTCACGSSDPEHVQKVQSHAACVEDREAFIRSHIRPQRVVQTQDETVCQCGTIDWMKSTKKRKISLHWDGQDMFLIKHRSFHSCRITRRQVQLYPVRNHLEDYPACISLRGTCLPSWISVLGAATRAYASLMTSFRSSRSS
jgi:hypothetical protein